MTWGESFAQTKNPGIAAGVLHFVLLSEVPVLRSGMKDAAPRPGHVAD